MTIAPPASNAPDWSAITDTIRCPLCEYDLRGLSEPRCPECGHEFQWREMLSADRRPHPYLFEHHPERNVWSFRQTKWHGLSPGTFWRTLQPLMRPSPRRLILYWLLSVPFVCIPLAWVFLSLAWDISADVQRDRQRLLAMGVANSASGQKWIDTYAPKTLSVGFVQRVWGEFMKSPAFGRSMDAPIILAFVAWPWLTIAAMNVFQISMRRAKIRQIHVVRCALYSCDSGLIAGIALLWVLSQASGRYNTLPFTGIAFVLSDAMAHLLSAAVLFALLATYKLAPAYRYYLRFPHAWATVIATQVLVALTVVGTIARMYRI